MPSVQNTVFINAPIEIVWEVAKHNELFPEFMSDVKSLTIVETDGNRVVSDWSAVVPQFLLKVKWRQEDIWDEEARTCTFRQIAGDYDALSGVWRFTEEEHGTRFDNECEYEYNVPTLGPLVKRVVHAIVVKNLENVLQAIKKRSEEMPYPEV